MGHALSAGKNRKLYIVFFSIILIMLNIKNMLCNAHQNKYAFYIKLNIKKIASNLLLL